MHVEVIGLDGESLFDFQSVFGIVRPDVKVLEDLECQ